MAVRGFSFFGKSLSRVAGEKCCPYGQNGQPLSKEYIIEFLKNSGEQLKYWRPNENFTMLTHSWYFKNYLQAAGFVLEVAKLDSNNILKQTPNMYIMKKEVLRIELTTTVLGGLSHADLSLAAQISLLPGKEYSLTPIFDEKNFRRELRMQMLENKN
ncbi:unnamed protein product [Blepharisma stoltei]|uniref:4a-hydroxytetrahydrobiopterin dehydratase n=1 Tax=Blepharisma stoltei TaxID=1481888 RepID=A0AAU9K3Z2_9CILI|nr:unnamed protein product [Blepharisma stoltei]